MALEQKIPTMTSNTTPSGVASASSVYNASTTPAWEAMDGNNSSSWMASSGATQWIQYQFASAEIIKAFLVRPTYDLGADTTFVLKASNTGAFSGEEVTLHSVTVPFLLISDNQFSFTNTTSYVYYRLYITQWQGGTTIKPELTTFGLMAAIPARASASISMSVSPSVFGGASSSLLLSVSASAKANPIERSSMNLTLLVSATGSRKQISEQFEIVQKLQLANTIKEFHIVQRLEQVSNAIMIKRVNS